MMRPDASGFDSSGGTGAEARWLPPRVIGIERNRTLSELLSCLP